MTEVLGLTVRISGFVFIIWFISASVISVTQAVKLHGESQVVASCGDNVTLTCEASSSRKLDIKSFMWLHRNKTVCKYDSGGPKLEDLCENVPHERLTLNLKDVMPVAAGNYLCKIRTTDGVDNTKTAVKVQDCYGSSVNSVSGSLARCEFSGVYPRGSVLWTQENITLTDSVETMETEAPDGRYDVWSTIEVRKANLSDSIQCCLSIPSARGDLPCQTLKLSSAGNIIKLQWICAIVEILVVKLVI